MSRLDKLLKIKDASPVILPSMLLCDFGNLEREIERLEKANVKALHLDVMDGDFVPNFTYGMTIVEAFRKVTDLPLDVHLMISNPDKYIDSFVDAGADIITFHIEAVENAQPVLEKIRAKNISGGVAFNAGTPVSKIENALPLCDLALVMSIEAGFGGQSFQPETLEKLSLIREVAGEEIVLEMDGVNSSTIDSCVKHGAQMLVVGSAIFRAEGVGNKKDPTNGYGNAIQILMDQITQN